MVQFTLSEASPQSKRSLDGRVVIVTGGSRGIGRAIVEQLVQHGAKVVFTYVSQHNTAEEVVRELNAMGGETLALQSDVRELKSAQKIIGQAIERFGRIDGLVNNAGIVRDKALMLMEPQDWAEVLETNLTGVFNFCRAAIVTFMKQHSGRIVNITSVAGLVGMSRQVNYSASKAGVIGFTKALAKEVASFGITVNAIAPGYIQTDMTNSIDKERKVDMEKLIPMGRFGKPEEVAGIVSVLMGSGGSYITGQVIVVDGGLAI